MAISPSLVFPVTDEQIQAFSIWAKNKYGTYNSYLVAFKAKAPAIDKYIRTYILPMEMKSALRETEPYIGLKGVDFHISRLQIYHQRILNKIKYMKGKLGKLAFPVEAMQIRIDNRAAILRRRQAILALCMRQQQYFAEYQEDVRFGLQFSPDIHPVIITTKIVTKQLSKEDAACRVNCGHQFGLKCLAKWNRIRVLFAGQKSPKQPCL
jgi:hypothetical protein